MKKQKTINNWCGLDEPVKPEKKKRKPRPKGHLTEIKDWR